MKELTKTRKTPGRRFYIDIEELAELAPAEGPVSEVNPVKLGVYFTVTEEETDD